MDQAAVEDPVVLEEFRGTRIGAVLTNEPWRLEADALAVPVDPHGEVGHLGQWLEKTLGVELVSNAVRDRVDPLRSEEPMVVEVPPDFSIPLRAVIAVTATPEHSLQYAPKTEVRDAAAAAAAVVRVAATHGFRRVLVPLVGTGAAGLDHDAVGRATLQYVKTALRSVPDDAVAAVDLVTNEPEVVELLEAATVPPRPHKTSNDLPVGDDLLNVQTEAESLADILMLRQLTPPLAVGILGGWGTGKSFVMRLMRERMNRIRSAPIASERAWPQDESTASEYVGHVYQIEFNAWTYAHSDLWSALMQTIFAELNRQLSLEKGLFERGISPFEGGEYWRVLNAMPEDERRAILHEDTPLTSISPGDLTGNGLWERLRSVKSADQKTLERLRRRRDEQQGQIVALRARVEGTGDRGGLDELVSAVQDKALQKQVREWARRRYNGAMAFALSGTRAKLAARSAGRTVRRWWPAAVAMIAAVVGAWFAPALWKAVLGVPAVAAFAAGAQSAIRTAAGWHRALARQVLADLEREHAATITAVERQRRVVGPVADFVSVAEFVDSRLGDGSYEERLGLMRQVYLDLAHLTAGLSILDPDLHKAEKQKNFPRGPARVVLYIDDLDRCPPRRVVQVFEAIQLLLTTQLFVVVVALDLRYVSRALEKVYGGILSRFGEPSGLDYIEKIIQIPYRTRPVRSEALRQFLGGHLPVAVALQQAATGAQASDATPQGANAAASTRRNATGNRTASTSRLIEFTTEESAILHTCCSVVSLSPRAIKRLVNVSKLMKLVWARSGRPDPTLPVVAATSLLLVLATRHGDVMRGVLSHLEDRALNDGSATLLDALTGYTLPVEERYLARDHALWLRDVQAFRGRKVTTQTAAIDLGEVSVGEVSDALDMVSSFSFLGDIGYEPDLHAGHDDAGTPRDSSSGTGRTESQQGYGRHP